MYDDSTLIPGVAMRFLLSLLLVLVSPAALAEPSAGCAGDAATPNGEHRLIMGDLVRRYLLDLPAARAGTPPALVLALHGYTGYPETIGDPTDAVVDHARDNGYVLVRPAGTTFDANLNANTAKALGVIDNEAEWPDLAAAQRRTNISSWNDLAASRSDGPAGPTCLPDADTYPCPPECKECGPCVWGSCHDDVGFIRSLIEHLDRGVCFDNSRVFVLGHSNGGMMAQALTCNLPGVFAGGASIKGQPPVGYSCSDSRSPSFIQITGAEDTTVPHDGTPSSDGYLYATSHHSALARATALRCSRGPVQVEATVDHPLSCELWDQCESGKRIADCVDPDGGHEWPGGLPENQWGLDLIWGFFTADTVFDEPQND